jgi:hypothetical protein
VHNHADHRRPRFCWLALCGLVPPLADLAIIWAAGAVQPDYNPTTQFISELGETGRPGASLVSAWWGLFTFVFSPFALVVYRRTPENVYRWMAPAALLTFALFSGVGSWLFPCDPGCAGETFSGQMHLLVNYVGTAGMVLAPLFVWLNARAVREWSRFARFSLAIYVVLAGLLIAMLYAVDGTGELATLLKARQGHVQRAFLLTFYVWLGVLALRMLLREKSTGEHSLSLRSSSMRATKF